MGERALKYPGTQSAPAEGTDRADAERQQLRIARSDHELAIMDALPVMTLALNARRETVYASPAFLRFLGNVPLASVLGRRPGEILGCVYADAGPEGCGTSRFCGYCGTAKAILQGIAGDGAGEEHRLLRIDAGQREALDLRVWATPSHLAGEPITLLTITDVRDEMRRQVLERLFFHDVLNTVSGIQSIAEMLREEEVDAREKQELGEILATAAERLVGEIESHRLVGLAESGELTTEVQELDVLEFLTEVVRGYGQRVIADEKALHVEVPEGVLAIRTDPTLLGRVLGNLLKNALEASQPGDAVVAAARESNRGVEFTVNNPAVMTEEVRRQVFHRSFSTKGVGRGLGTWSIKLLTETYLGGRVSFTSIAGDGTTFRVWLPGREE